MNSKKSRFITIALAALLSVSFVACNKEDKKGTTVTTSDPDSSKKDNTDSQKDDNKEGAVTTFVIPENDDDGSKITIIQVTDAENNPVTDTKGSEVTKLAVVDDEGQIVTDAQGSEVAPNITTPAATTKSDRIVATEQTQPNVAETTAHPNASPVLADGPTLTIPSDLEAAPGEEFTFKISVTGNVGYCALIAWLDMNEKYFDFVSFQPGDPDSNNYNRSPEKQNTTMNEYRKPGVEDTLTLVMLYFDGAAKNLEGDTTYATITLKAKDDLAPGKYDICFDPVGEAGNAMCNRVVNAEAVVLTPKYINGSVTIK